jgi:uncharacterized membrane protein
MKLKIIISILILLIIVNLGIIGSYIYFQFVKTEPIYPSRTEKYRVDHRRSELKLNRNQRKQLRKLLRELEKDTEELKLRLHTLEKDAFALLSLDSIPQDKFDQKLKEINELRFTISQKSFQKMIEAKEALSYEQQQHFFRALIQMEMGSSKGLYPGSPSEHRSNSKSKRNHIQENEERKK